MAKLIHAQMHVDGLSMQAYRVLNATLAFAMHNSSTALHKIPLVDFYRLAHLAASTTRMYFARIVDDVKEAKAEPDGIDISRPDNEVTRFGCRPAFQNTEVTDTHFEFQFCRYLRHDGCSLAGIVREYCIRKVR
jgi:hypothetical protein